MLDVPNSPPRHLDNCVCGNSAISQRDIRWGRELGCETCNWCQWPWSRNAQLAGRWAWFCQRIWQDTSVPIPTCCFFIPMCSPISPYFHTRNLANDRYGIAGLRGNEDLTPKQPATWPLVVSKAPSTRRLSWPRFSLVIKISAPETTSTSSTTSLRLLLRSSKYTLDSLLGRLHYQTPPIVSDPHQLPHRTGSESLPLAEGESRRPRQVTEGPACYRFRPP